MDRQTNRLVGQIDGQTDKQTVGQINRQTDKQTFGQIDTQTVVLKSSSFSVCLFFIDPSV
jgi:hypothetical protein